MDGKKIIFKSADEILILNIEFMIILCHKQNIL